MSSSPSTLPGSGPPRRLGVRAASVLLPALLVGTLAAGCSGDRTVLTSESDAGDSSAGRTFPGGAEQAAPEAATDAAASPVNRTLVQDKAVVRTARVAVTAVDLSLARDQVDRILFGVGGTIDHEETTHDRDGTIQRSTLVLRVPVDQFGETLDALERVGTLQTSDRQAQDVTTEVIDLDERVQTLQNSLDRLQRLQRDSASLEDLLRLEQEITQREGELRSLESQQSYLADQTALSTITLRMTTPPTLVDPLDTDDAGFLAGLEAGWNALTAVVLVALTALGAALPFLGLTLLAAVPVWLLVRAVARRRPGLAATAPASTAPASTAPADASPADE